MSGYSKFLSFFSNAHNNHQDNMQDRQNVMQRFLTEDLILEIFSKAPFESLSECRLVSKAWKNLIITHLSKPHPPSSDSKVGFISLNMLQNDRVELLYLEYHETDHNEQKVRISKINHPLISREHYDELLVDSHFETPTVIIGSSNGLICLSIPSDAAVGVFDDPLYICNPITGEYILLPMCCEKCLEEGRNVFGFGYNDKTNEYKAVRIYYESYGHTEPGQVQVYTLGAGTGWRNKGEVAYSIRSNSSHSPGMNADGEVYWLHQGISDKDWVSEEMISYEGRVVAFNLADEVFRVLPNPPFHTTTTPWGEEIVSFLYYQIQVLGGCLCYIHETDNTSDIWSFKKNNGTKKEEDSSNWGLVGTMQARSMTLVPFFDLTKSEKILYSDFLRNDSTGLDVFETIRHENSFVSLKALGEENVKMFDRIN